MEATQTDAQATQTDAETPIEERIESLMVDEEETPDPEPKQEEDQETILEDTPEEDATSDIELDATQLAQMFNLGNEDISISDDGAISFKTNIDGKKGSANLSDLIKSYQLEGHTTKKSMELSEQQQQFTAYTQQAQQNLDIQLQQSSALMGAAEQQLNGEYNSIDWPNLRVENPAEFAAMQQEFNARNQEIQSLKQNATVTYQNQKQQLEQNQYQANAQQEAQERKLLMTALPEWSDESVASKEKQEIINYMNANKWPQELMQGVNKFHHALLAVRSLVKQSASNPESKKVQRKPRAVLKSGSAKTQTEANRKRSESQRNKLRSSGSVDDLAGLLIDRI